MEITASTVKDLREQTGVGMMECKKALVETNGDMEKAIDLLRKKGIASAAKKAGRIATEGLVSSYIHAGGKIGVLVEVNCETDFVAKTDTFQALVKDISMHIAAANPLYVRQEEIPSTLLEKEREIYKAQALESGKPVSVIDKIVDGKISKFCKDICLLDQPFVKDNEKTIQQLLLEKIASIGENISIRRFARFHLGEGLAKREDDFAKEVAAMSK